jgi:predicted extracellular nuclease
VSRLRLRLAVITAAVVSLALAGGANAASSELFFSEYVEGSSFNKAVEIFNGTGADVPLAGYSVQTYFNGNPSAGSTINLSGTLADGDVYVIADSQAGSDVSAAADPSRSRTGSTATTRSCSARTARSST